MFKIFLRTLVVVGVVWVVACADDTTLPTIPPFSHITEDLGRDAAYHA